jgi:oligopeptide/dipeptide ABC transporter ATP-binding protein
VSFLTVRDLRVTFPAAGDRVIAPVDGVGFSLDRGELLALVGESGCGKTMTSLALLQLVPPPGVIAPGSSITLDGQDLLTMEGDALRALRGGRIGMVFQDPSTSLNPVFSAADQLVEAIRAHRPLTAPAARAEAGRLLAEVGVPAERHEAYPHQLSGGLRQRVMIAIALAGDPGLLIADEPTTALDVTVQAQILELLDRLRQARGMAVLLITHDLGLVAGRADRVAVMYAGQIVEMAGTGSLFQSPAHPYTRGLFAALPRLDQAARLAPIGGAVPDPSAWPAACRFHPRCPAVLERCRLDSPPGFSRSATHQVRCWLNAPEGA